MLKYQSEIDKIESCPDVSFKEGSSKAYHFVFEEEGKQNKNFLPAIKKTPRRRSAFKKKGTLCQSYSLSMFKTEKQAILFFKKLQKKHKAIYTDVGNSIAEGKINKKHGLMGSTRVDGHFSFFEKEEVELRKIFKIINTKL